MTCGSYLCFSGCPGRISGHPQDPGRISPMLGQLGEPLTNSYYQEVESEPKDWTTGEG